MAKILEFKKKGKKVIHLKKKDEKLSRISKLTFLIASEVNKCETKKEVDDTILMVTAFMLGLSKKDPALKEAMKLIVKIILDGGPKS